VKCGNLHPFALFTWQYVSLFSKADVFPIESGRKVNKDRVYFYTWLSGLSITQLNLLVGEWVKCDSSVLVICKCSFMNCN
jgi:hypothetical protein